MTTATQTQTTVKPYAVNLYESHPDENNDDCRTGLDFDDEIEAHEAMSLPQDYFKARSLDGCTHIELTGPNGLRRVEALMSERPMQTKSPAIVELRNPIIVDVFEPDCYWNSSMGVCPLNLVEGDSGRCALCGQAITWRVVVTSEGKHYSIGRDCARSIAKISGAAISNRSKRAEARSAAARAMEEAEADAASFCGRISGERTDGIGFMVQMNEAVGSCRAELSAGDLLGFAVDILRAGGHVEWLLRAAELRGP